MSDRPSFTLAGTLMLPPGDEPKTVRLQHGRVRVADGRITGIEHGSSAAEGDIGGPDWLICPGFIDAHLHLPQVDAVGGFGLELLEWLERVIFPAEQCWADGDLARRGIAAALDTLMSFGTTGFCAFSSIHPDATRIALELAAVRNLRCAIGPIQVDRDGPPSWMAPAQQRIAEAEALLQAFPPHPRKPRSPRNCRTAAMVAPRFAPMCSMELMRGLAERAGEAGALIASHIAETQRECELAAAAHVGESYAAIYHRAGLLGRRTLLGHGIHLCEADRRLLVRTGTVIVHCPTANRFLGSGRMDRAALAAAGVRLALGSDLGAGGERCMVRVARAMLEAAREAGHPLPAAHGWWQITAGNAEALGFEQTGAIAAQHDADLLLIRPPDGWQDGPDPLAKLMFTWDDRWLRAVVVDGRWVWPGSHAAAPHP